MTETSTGPNWTLLVRGALEADAESLRQLLQEMAPIVRRTCRSVLGPSHSDLEDAIQESLLAVVRALAAWRGEGQFPHYVTKISLRAAINTRRRVRHHQQSIQEGDLVHAFEPQDPLGDNDFAHATERGELLRDMLQALPYEQAEVLVLRFMLGYSLEETAQMTDSRLNTAKTRIRLAKSVLRRKIAKNPRAVMLFGPRFKS